MNFLKGLLRFPKRILKKIYKRVKLFAVRVCYRLDIMSAEQTIEYIKKSGCSIARYGDGEFDLVLSKRDISFQKHSDEISSALREVLISDDENLLVCIPGTFNTFKGRTDESKKFWREWALTNDNRKKVSKLLLDAHRKYRYGNAQITRPYIAMKSSKHAAKIFPLFRSIWEERDIFVLEGEQTRLGVGNDLFDNAASVKRILAPATDAFFARDAIISKVCELVPKGSLIILALGPTATVLASDLSKLGYQALDIGHIDNEYEWYKAGAKKRFAIPGKYTNEADGGRTIADAPADSSYERQIAARVGGSS